MWHRHKKTWKKIFIVFGALVILFGSLCVWLYHGSLTPTKIKVFTVLPLPMALVNGNPVAMKNLIFRYSLAKNMLGGTTKTQDDQELKTQIYSQLINEEETRQLAAKFGVWVTPSEIDANYKNYTAQTDLEGKKNFEELLKNYGVSVSTFKNEVLKPILLITNLQLWLSSNKDQNEQAHTQAQGLLEQIKNNGDMQALATQTTQDEAGKQVGGDLGFLDPVALLPELTETISNMKPGETKIIPSRFGLHIVELEEKNGNQVHLRQIFIKTLDFSSWFKEQTKNYKTTKLINLNF